MRIKTVTWTVSSRFLEVAYEDGVKGSIRAPEEWGDFHGVVNTHEAGIPSTHVRWGYGEIPPYALYMMIKENSDALSSLTNYRG